MPYAENTEVPVEKSISEIIALVKRAGAERIAQMEEPDRIAIQFFLNDRLLRFAVRMPSWTDMPEYINYRFQDEAARRRKAAQKSRQKVRALLLVIKAKLESVDSEVESFDEAFLGNVVTPDGPTVADWLIPQIEEGYRIGKMPSQLLLGHSA